MQPITIAIIVVIVFLIAGAVILACLRAQTALRKYDERPPIDLSGQGRPAAPKHSRTPRTPRAAAAAISQRPGQSHRVDVTA